MSASRHTVRLCAALVGLGLLGPAQAQLGGIVEAVRAQAQAAESATLPDATPTAPAATSEGSISPPGTPAAGGADRLQQASSGDASSGLARQLQAQLSGQDELIGTLQGDLASKATELAGLQGRIGEMTALIEGLQGEKGDLLAQFGALQGDLAERVAEVGTLRADLAERVAEVGQLQGELQQAREAASTELASVRGERDGLNADLDVTRESLRAAETASGEHQTRLAELETELAGAGSELAALNESGTALQARAEDAEAALGEASGVNAVLSNRLDSVETQRNLLAVLLVLAVIGVFMARRSTAA